MATQIIGMNPHGHGRVRETGTLASTSLKFNLEEEIRQLQTEPRWQAGHTAKTIAKYTDLRVVLVVMAPGARLSRHRTAGRISIQGLRGTIYVKFSGEFKTETVEVLAGDLLMLDREVPHEVEALTDSAFLLSIAWPSLDPALTGEILGWPASPRRSTAIGCVDDGRWLAGHDEPGWREECSKEAVA